MQREVDDSFTIFRSLYALCCLTHFSTHLDAVDTLDPGWWLACAVVIGAAATLSSPTMRRFLCLATLQVAHLIADAPFNPDHWLLLSFVSLVFLWSAGTQWLRRGQIVESELYSMAVPSARMLFLICYGFAAFSKFNTHFLGSYSSCAAELAELQAAVSPWLGPLSVPALAGWTTAVCESFVVLLLLTQRTRRLGILLGIVFHTMLVISPAIAVFDFTMTVYAMLFLFAPSDTGQRLRNWKQAKQETVPVLSRLASRSWTPLCMVIAAFVVARSASGSALHGDVRLDVARWIINMAIAATTIGLAWFVLFQKTSATTRDARKQGVARNVGVASTLSEISLRPRSAFHGVVLVLALLNGMCPYLGLKTQGSFTMFSNLQTEAGNWNHIVVPPSVRVFSRFQDNLVQLAMVDNPRLQQKFVARDYLVPIFEIQREIVADPDLKLTMIENGRPIQLSPAAIHPRLGTSPSWLMRKLLIFRPVTPDGSPYCGN